MLEMFWQNSFNHDGSISALGATLSVGSLLAIGIFSWMAQNSLNDRRGNSQALREEEKRERRATAIAAATRRELAASNEADGRPIQTTSISK